MRLKVRYVIRPEYIWASIAHMARIQDGELLKTLQAGLKYIENELFHSTFSMLFSKISLGSEKLGKTYVKRNNKLCSIITKIVEGLEEFSTDALGDAYEYFIGQFAAGSGKKAGEFYTPQQISNILSAIVTLDSQEPKTGEKRHHASVLDFACGSGSLLLNVRNRMGAEGIGKIYGQENNITTYNLARMNMLLHGVKDTPFEIHHGDTLKTNGRNFERLIRPESQSLMPWSPIPHSASSGNLPKPLARTCDSRTMDWLRSQRRTFRFCYMAFITSRTMVLWLLFCPMVCCSGAVPKQRFVASCLMTEALTQSLASLRSCFIPLASRFAFSC